MGSGVEFDLEGKRGKVKEKKKICGVGAGLFKERR